MAVVSPSTLGWWHDDSRRSLPSQRWISSAMRRSSGPMPPAEKAPRAARGSGRGSHRCARWRAHPADGPRRTGGCCRGAGRADGTGSCSVKSQHRLHSRILRAARKWRWPGPRIGFGARRMWKASRAAVFSPTPGSLQARHQARDRAGAAHDGLAPRSMRLDLLGAVPKKFLGLAAQGCWRASLSRWLFRPGRLPLRVPLRSGVSLARLGRTTSSEIWVAIR